MDKVLLRKGDLYNTWLKNICGVEEGCTERGVMWGGRLCRQWGFAEMGLCVECVRQKLHIFSSLQVHTTELRCISYPAQFLFYTSNVNSTHCSHCSAHPLLRNHVPHNTMFTLPFFVHHPLHASCLHNLFYTNLRPNNPFSIQPNLYTSFFLQYLFCITLFYTTYVYHCVHYTLPTHPHFQHNNVSTHTHTPFHTQSRLYTSPLFTQHPFSHDTLFCATFFHTTYVLQQCVI